MANERNAETKAAPAVALTFDQLKELLAEAKGSSISPTELAQIAASAAAEGAAKAKMPENKQAPMVSAFNPLGERDHPRPALRCWMYFGSAPIGSPRENHTLTVEEIIALNAVMPGHYRITKMDGSQAVIEVRGQMNSNRELERLWILLPEGDEQRNLYPRLADFAAQCVDANRVQPAMVA